MSPRTYQSTKRKQATEATRARIVAAARALLISSDHPLGFSVDGVAREAGVARMTVYYQFQSKRGLYEAISDDLATRADLGARVGAAFQCADAVVVLDSFIGAFAHFWTGDRVIIRRLDGLAALDAEIGQGNQARNERRRAGLRTVLSRLVAQEGIPTPAHFDQAVTILQPLTSFAFFDNLAGPTHTPEDVVAVVQYLARATLGLPTTLPILTQPSLVITTDLT